MTTFLLNLDFLSTAMRERKLVATATSEEELQLLNSMPVNLLLTRGAWSFFSFMMRCLFEASISKGVTVDEDDQNWLSQYRDTAVAAYAARKMMQLYADPYTRASLRYRPSPRVIGFPKVLELLLRSLPNDPLDSAMLVSGLRVQDIFQIIITDPYWHAAFGTEFGDRIVWHLLASVAVKPTAWKAFSVEARARVAHELLSLYQQCSSRYDDYLQEKALEIWTHLFAIVVGFNLLTIEAADNIWLDVVTLASTADIGPYPGGFSKWRQRVGYAAVSKLQEMAGVRRDDTGEVYLELMPPPLMEHIIEYAMDPFSVSPMEKIMDTMIRDLSFMPWIHSVSPR